MLVLVLERRRGDGRSQWEEGILSVHRTDGRKSSAAPQVDIDQIGICCRKVLPVQEYSQSSEIIFYNYFILLASLTPLRKDMNFLIR